MSLASTTSTLTYPDGDSRVTALDGVSLTVRAGTVTAIIGPSGAASPACSRWPRP